MLKVVAHLLGLPFNMQREPTQFNLLVERVWNVKFLLVENKKAHSVASKLKEMAGLWVLGNHFES